MALSFLSQGVEVGLVTTNPEPMVEFYEQFLGLPSQGELAFPGGHQRRFALGGNVVKIVTFDPPPAEPADAAGGHSRAGIAYLTFGVEDLTAAAEQIAASGYRLMQPLAELDTFPGFGFLYLADPDGNWIELYGPTNTGAA